MEQLRHTKQEVLIVVTINSQVTAIYCWASANLEVVHMLAGRVRRVVIPRVGYPRIVQHTSYVISTQQARLPEAYGQIILVVMKPFIGAEIGLKYLASTDDVDNAYFF